jgi:hypothetical protein
MRNHQDQIMEEFTEFRIGMEKQRLPVECASSFLVTYESGKLLAVEILPNPWGQSVRQKRWVWEITGDELTLEHTGFNTEVLCFKRV